MKILLSLFFLAFCTMLANAGDVVPLGEEGIEPEAIGGRNIYSSCGIELSPPEEVNFFEFDPYFDNPFIPLGIEAWVKGHTLNIFSRGLTSGGCISTISFELEPEVGVAPKFISFMLRNPTDEDIAAVREVMQVCDSYPGYDEHELFQGDRFFSLISAISIGDLSRCEIGVIRHSVFFQCKWGIEYLITKLFWVKPYLLSEGGFVGQRLGFVFEKRSIQ